MQTNKSIISQKNHLVNRNVCKSIKFYDVYKK